MSQRKAAIEAELCASREDFLAVANGLGEGDDLHQTDCEGWTVKDVIIHVCASEPGLTSMARIISQGKGTAVPGFDLNRYNQRQIEKRRERSIHDLLDELAAARQQTLALLETFSDADLDRRGQQTGGEEKNVEETFYQLARHDRQHTAHLRGALA